MNPERAANSLMLREKIKVVLRGPDGEIKDMYESENVFPFADLMAGKPGMDAFKIALGKELHEKLEKQKREETR